MNDDARLSDIPTTWTFESSAVAAGFDRHVREQLPWYDLATKAVAHVVRHYLPVGGIVYDIGASTGNVGRSISDLLSVRNATLIPIEASAEMAERYAGPDPDRLVVADASEFQFGPFDVAVAFLTFMFVPPSERLALVERLRSKVRKGGAIIIVDKTVAASGYVATVLWRLTLAGKLAAGVPPAEILAKELSLGGVQRPISVDELGPGAIEWFRFGEFAGWIVEG